MGESAPPRRLDGNGLQGDSDRDNVIPEGMNHLVAEGDTVEHLVEEPHRHREQLGLALVELFHLGQQLN